MSSLTLRQQVMEVMSSLASFATNPAEVLNWKAANEASIKKTAERFRISVTSVKRYMAAT